MKIVIDTADLDCERIDGTRVYIQNVLKYLGGLAPEDDFFLLHKNKYNKLLEPAKFVNYHSKSIPSKIWWTQLRFAREVKKIGAEVVWMPIQQIPFLVESLKSKVKSHRTKYVVTIHDLAFKFFPNHFPWLDRIKLNLYTDIAVKKADKVIAISESTKDDIIRLYPKINHEKIVVVHHGFDRKNFTQEFSEREKREFLRKWSLESKVESRKSKVVEDYLLYVGAIQPRKDLVTLIRAFESIKLKVHKVESQMSKVCKVHKAESRPTSQELRGIKNLKLVLVGEVAWKSEKTMEAVANSKFKEDIIVTGRVNFKELAMFYRWAKVFVFPSLYEGFGIPILEAMASKTPVIVADNSSLPEIGGEAVLKFKSGSVKKLAKQLERLLGDKDLQEEIIKKGLEQIEKFSWEKCAKETLRVVESLKSKV